VFGKSNLRKSGVLVVEPSAVEVCGGKKRYAFRKYKQIENSI